MRATVPAEEFHRRGIGLVFFEARMRDILLTVGLEPSMSTRTNRSFKKLLYSRFCSQYGEEAYA
jgi:hypothetical protein